MPRMSLADILNPAGWNRHIDRELKVQIEGARLQQRSQIHQNEMSATYEGLRQADRHHNDKMNAQARQDSIRERQNEIAEKQFSERLEIDKARLAFDIDKALSERDASVKTALIQTQKELLLAAMSHKSSMELLNQDFRNKTSLINQQGHADFVKAGNMLFVNKVQSFLKRGDDINSAFAAALADMMRERQKEKHRENERKHEITMAILKSNLDRSGFTYEEILKLAIRLVDPTTGKVDEDELFRKYENWYNKAFDK